MELLAIFVQNILPIFIVACIGFLIVRYLEADVRTLSRVTIYVLTPCLLFDVLVTSDVSADEFGRLTLLALGTILGIGLIAWLAARALRLDRVMTSAFMVVVMFANGGNYGLPLTLFVFGQEALARATIYFVVSIVLTYTIGIFLASSGRRSLGEALLSVLRIPSIYASAAAIVVIFTGVATPSLLMRPIKLLGDAAIPVMILVLGMQLERAVKPARLRLVGLAVGLRLIVSALLGLLLAQFLGLGGAARQAGVLQSAMPVAVVTTILAVEFEVEPAFVTSVVFLSTILSPLTLTPLIALLK
ncbi:MAG TPA: AEC family transporter [Deltaproteobacteria bacterium]|jgi:predicted permease|nr:AEC family transporter [Deltaproteobacteria bacterium]HIJ76006.1 AEC family transporter [Deltaproteobacteria bacterium]